MAHAWLGAGGKAGRAGTAGLAAPHRSFALGVN